MLGSQKPHARLIPIPYPRAPPHAPHYHFHPRKVFLSPPSVRRASTLYSCPRRALASAFARPPPNLHTRSCLYAPIARAPVACALILLCPGGTSGRFANPWMRAQRIYSQTSGGSLRCGCQGCNLFPAKKDKRTKR